VKIGIFTHGSLATASGNYIVTSGFIKQSVEIIFSLTVLLSKMSVKIHFVLAILLSKPPVKIHFPLSV
jgi:hypothetical protein